MSDIADRIAERLQIMKISERAASIAATGSPNTIRQIRLGTSKNPRSDTLKKLAPVLGCSADWLLTGVSEERPQSNAKSADINPLSRNAMSRDIPVRGTAAGSMNGRGAFQITPDTIDYVARPPGLANARDIYALYIEGDSMEPRFFAGDLVYVHPHKPVRVNDVVVLQEQTSNNGEPQAFIKVFLKKSAKGILAQQYNPPAEITFVAPGTIMHKVLTNNELFGV